MGSFGGYALLGASGAWLATRTCCLVWQEPRLATLLPWTNHRVRTSTRTPMHERLAAPCPRYLDACCWPALLTTSHEPRPVHSRASRAYDTLNSAKTDRTTLERTSLDSQHSSKLLS